MHGLHKSMGLRQHGFSQKRWFHKRVEADVAQAEYPSRT
jgi:hypothetical protein